MRKLLLLHTIFILIFCNSNAQNSGIKICGGTYPILIFKSFVSIEDICDDIDSSSVQSYNVFYQTKLGDAVVIKNKGAAFPKQRKAVVSKAKPGDIYYFEDIRIGMTGNIIKKRPGFAIKIM